MKRLTEAKHERTGHVFRSSARTATRWQVSLGQMRQWITEGRVNAQTRVQEAGAAEWKAAGQFPELGFAPAGGVPHRPSAPPPLAGQASAPQSALAITSFVLGLLSLTCLGLLTGIPAVICGHLAARRARRSPGQYGGVRFRPGGLDHGLCWVPPDFGHSVRGVPPGPNAGQGQGPRDQLPE